MAQTPRAAPAGLVRRTDDKSRGLREDSRRGDAPPARSAEEGIRAPQVETGPASKRARGRPKEQNGTVVLTLRLPPDVVAAIDGIVERSGPVYRDRSEFIRHTLVSSVERIADAEKAERAAEVDLAKKQMAEARAMLEAAGLEMVGDIPLSSFVGVLRDVLERFSLSDPKTGRRRSRH